MLLKEGKEGKEGITFSSSGSPVEKWLSRKFYGHQIQPKMCRKKNNIYIKNPFLSCNGNTFVFPFQYLN